MESWFNMAGTGWHDFGIPIEISILSCYPDTSVSTVTLSRSHCHSHSLSHVTASEVCTNSRIPEFPELQKSLFYKAGQIPPILGITMHPIIATLCANVMLRGCHTPDYNFRLSRVLHTFRGPTGTGLVSVRFPKKYLSGRHQLCRHVTVCTSAMPLEFSAESSSRAVSAAFGGQHVERLWSKTCEFSKFVVLWWLFIQAFAVYVYFLLLRSQIYQYYHSDVTQIDQNSGFFDGVSKVVVGLPVRAASYHRSF
jgi:hypothetical protein